MVHRIRRKEKLPWMPHGTPLESHEPILTIEKIEGANINSDVLGDVLGVETDQHRHSDLSDTARNGNVLGIEADRNRTSDLVDALADAHGIGDAYESDVYVSIHDDDSSQSNPNDDDVLDFVLNDNDQDPNQEDDGDAAQGHEEGDTDIGQNEKFLVASETTKPKKH